MRRLPVCLLTCAVVLLPAVSVAQGTGRGVSGITVQVFDAIEFDQARRLAPGLSAEITRRYEERRLSAAGVIRTRLPGAQSFDGTARVRFSARTTLAASSRLSYATRVGDDISSSAWASSGLAAATNLGLAHQTSRRTTVGISYRLDRVRYIAGTPAVVAKGIGVGIWRAANRHLTWQAGYDFGWSGAQSHSGVLQAQYRLVRYEGTSLTIAVRPTTSVGGVQRTTVMAGLIRVDHALDGRRRIGLGYERSLSLLESSDRAVVTDVLSAHLSARTRRVTMAASVQASGARRINAAVSLQLRMSRRAALFGEFTHAGQGGVATFSRTTIRVGATVAVTGRTLE